MSDEEEAPPLPCCLCGICEDDQLRFGQLFKLDDIAVHHFCLLFSPHMGQHGKDDEGAEGFLPRDIKIEKARASSTMCCYCDKGGATSHCMSIKCSKKYHVGCAVRANGLLQFFGKFKSFCEEHRPRQNVIGGDQGEACSICLEETDVNDQLNVLWTPCCKHFFHRACLQRMAYHFGYFFYCPGCRNKDSISGFLRHMRHFGIFIPKRDASWEMVPNAFGELLERHLMCDVRYCLCVQGRQHQASEIESPWRLCVCEMCGSSGTHLACSDLPGTITRWVCPACTLQPEAAPSDKCTLRAFFERRPSATGEGTSSGGAVLSGPLSLHDVLAELEEPEQLIKFSISPISGLSVATRRLHSERVPVREPGGRPVQYHPLQLLPETTVTPEDQREAELRLWSENHVTEGSDDEDGWSSYEVEKRKPAAPASSRRPIFGNVEKPHPKKPATRLQAHTSPIKEQRPGPACSKGKAGALGLGARARSATAAAATAVSRGPTKSRETSIDWSTAAGPSGVAGVLGPGDRARSAATAAAASAVSRGPTKSRESSIDRSTAAGPSGVAGALGPGARAWSATAAAAAASAVFRGPTKSRESSIDRSTSAGPSGVAERAPAAGLSASVSKQTSTPPSVLSQAKGKPPVGPAANDSVVELDSQVESDDSSVIMEPESRSSKGPGWKGTSQTKGKSAAQSKFKPGPTCKNNADEGELSKHALLSGHPERSARKVASYVEISDSDGDNPDDPNFKDQSDVEDVTPQNVKAAYTTPDKSIQAPGRKLVIAHEAPTLPSGLFPSNPLPSIIGDASTSEDSASDPHLKLVNRARSALFGYPCPICGKTHQTLTQATLHYYTHNVGESLFRCKICCATFSYWQPAHVRSEHPQVKPEEVFNQMENRFEQGKRCVAKLILDKKGIEVGDMLDHVLDASANLLKVHLPGTGQQKEKPPEVGLEAEKGPAQPQTLEQLRDEYKRKQREKEEREQQQKHTLEELRRQHQQKQQQTQAQKHKQQEIATPIHKFQKQHDVKQEKSSVGSVVKPDSAPKTQAQALLSGLATIRAQEQVKKDKLAALKSARIDKIVAKPKSTSITADVGVETASASTTGGTSVAESVSPQKTVAAAEPGRRFTTVQCEDCNFRGIASAVSRHRAWHTPEADARRRKLKYRCTRCYYASNVAAHVQIHLVCVHFMDSSAGGGSGAPGCIDPSPMSEAAWKMARALGAKTSEDGDGDKPDIGLRRFDCAFCDCFFMDRAGYYAHYQDWHMKHKGLDLSRPCPYDNCYANDVDGHSKWYHKAAPVRNRVCSQCGGTIYEGKEKQHKKTSCRAVPTLSQRLQFECPMPVCGFGSSEQDKVSHHLAQCHSLWIRGLSGSRAAPYRCPKCCGSFIYKHMKTHVLQCDKKPPPEDPEPKHLTKLLDIKPKLNTRKTGEPATPVKQEPFSTPKKASGNASSGVTQFEEKGPQRRFSAAKNAPDCSHPPLAGASSDEDNPEAAGGDGGDYGRDDYGYDEGHNGDDVWGRMPDSDSSAKRAVSEPKKSLTPVIKTGVEEEEEEDGYEAMGEYKKVSLGGFMGMAEFAPFIEGEDGVRDIDGKFVCGFCPATFEVPPHKHRFSKHRQELRAMNMFVITCVRPTGLLCPICGHVGARNSKWVFVMHIIKHNIFVPDSCLPNKVNIKQEPETPKPTKKNKKEASGATENKPVIFQCVTCSAYLPNKASLEVHVREHAQKRPRDSRPEGEPAKRKIKR